MRKDTLDTLAPATRANQTHPITAAWPQCEAQGWCNAIGGAEWWRIVREWEALPSSLKTDAAGFIRWRANVN